MQCRICGSEHNVEFRLRSLMSLCGYCHKTTPAKVGRAQFDREYWGEEYETVPESIRREFFDDYRTSSAGSVAEYRKQTSDQTSDVEV